MIRPLIVAIAISIVASGTTFADDDTTALDDIPHVTMVGVARIEVPPDLATIMLGVTSEKPNAATAADANAVEAGAIVAAAKGQGVAPRDIATQSVTLSQTFDEVRLPNGGTTRKPRGFEADTTIAIKVRDLAKAGAIAASLIAKGANRFDGITYAVEHPEPIIARLVGAAVSDARAQAQSAAEAAGLRLARVLQIERPDGDAGARMPRRAYARMGVMPGAPAHDMPLEAGTSLLTATVAVTWAIEPK